MPPTEKKGRRHTSTITVAVLEESEISTTKLSDKDLVERFCRSGGKGGQNVNKVNTAVQLVHKPSGIAVRVETRNQGQNRRIARERLQEKLDKLDRVSQQAKLDNERYDQVGNGRRGDKSRTIDEKHNYVINHATGKQISYKDYCKGRISELW